MTFVAAIALLLPLALPADAAVEPYPTWGFTLAAGPYQPDMGQQQGYYRAIYAAENSSSLFAHRPLMTSVEVDWYLIRDYGLLGPMLRIRAWKVSAPTRYCGDASSPVVCTTADIVAGSSTAGTDKTTLAVYPLSMGAVYKLDTLKRATNVPLVPTIKGALSYNYWRNSTGTGISRHGTRRGEGGTWGAEAALGLALSLDWMEPDAARRGYASTGLTDSYLFGEWTRMWNDGFGDDSRLNLSADLIQVGLVFDFE